jgi:hypothetical protein
MNRNEYPDMIEQASDWLTGTVKRNPEAFLVLAPGCALLLRGRRGSLTIANWSASSVIISTGTRMISRAVSAATAIGFHDLGRILETVLRKLPVITPPRSQTPRVRMHLVSPTMPMMPGGQWHPKLPVSPTRPRSSQIRPAPRSAQVPVL